MSKIKEAIAKKVKVENTPLPVKMVHEDYTPPLPTFSLNQDQLPELKNWAVGEKYNLLMEVEMTSQSKGDSYGMEVGGSSDQKKKKMEGRFRVLNVSTKNNKVDEMKEKFS